MLLHFGLHKTKRVTYVCINRVSFECVCMPCMHMDILFRYNVFIYIYLFIYLHAITTFQFSAIYIHKM